jgi:hypothetical protein
MVCREIPMAATSELLSEHDTRLWRVLAHYVEEIQAKREWSFLKRVFIDKTSSKRGIDALPTWWMPELGNSTLLRSEMERRPLSLLQGA